MKFIKSDFKDLLIIEHESFVDKRGVFKEIFLKNKLEEFLGYQVNFCQDNLVNSSHLTLRGLHFQREPYSQAKYISVTDGKILDVVVDIRRQSKTYGNHLSLVLSSINNRSLFIPKGFAHGYLTLSTNAVINYKVDEYYNKKAECGIPYNDKKLNIDWGIDCKKILISDKDKNLSDFKW